MWRNELKCEVMTLEAALKGALCKCLYVQYCATAFFANCTAQVSNGGLMVCAAALMLMVLWLKTRRWKIPQEKSLRFILFR